MTRKNASNNSSPSQFLNSVIDSSFFGIMAFKSVRNAKKEIVDFEWIFANKVACEIVNFKPEELIGSRLLDLLPGNKDTGLFNVYREVVETGEFRSLEQYYKADDIDTWFQISAAKLGDGFTVTFQDISEFKKVQAEIETKSKKYKKLFEESMDAIFLLDKSFRFLDINPAMCALFDLSYEKILTNSIKELFPSSEDYKRLEKKLKQKENIEELEVTLSSYDNIRKQCLINCVPVYDEEKQEQNYLGVIRDITKRKQAEQELFMAEKLSMTGKLARTIAHEIRNPLTNLSLALEQLREEIHDKAEDADLYLSIIDRNSKRIGKLINDLLNSSKPKELNLKKQSLHALIRDSLSLVEDRIKLQQMETSINFHKNDILLPLDADQFRIALLNLFINAIEAMKPEKGKLHIGTNLEGNRIKIIIKDNGKGISAMDQEQLFEPFFTSKKKGSGLGLTTVQNIIHAHHGNIDVESRIGKGTTFTVRFQTDTVD